MNDRELELQLRGWFHAEVPVSEAAPAALRASVIAIPRTVSPPAVPAWSRRRVALLAVAAALSVAILGLLVLGPGTQPSPSPSPSVRATTVESEGASAWEPAAPMHTARKWATATLLADGRVLVAGGADALEDVAYASAEIFDPTTGTWTETGRMSRGRYMHTATLLADGRVLVVGGSVAEKFGGGTSNAEVYDPATGDWTPTGSLHDAVASQTATLLGDGRVLIASNAAPAETYDAGTGTFTVLGRLRTPRERHTATLLLDGRVLIAGGYGDVGQTFETLDSGELFDVATGRWQATGSLANRRGQASAILLDDGRVLLAGGQDPYSSTFSAPTAAELYDPEAGSWSPGGELATSRAVATLVKLGDGTALIIGGIHPLSTAETEAMASVERYSPATDTWTAAVPMSVARFGNTTTLLRDGRVLVVGGVSNAFGPALASAEIFAPESQ